MNDTFKMNGFTEILGGLIRQQVIDDALADRGIEVTDANRKAARQEIDAQLKSQQSSKVDPALVDWAVDTRASQLALTGAVSKTDPADREKALRDAYEQLKGDYAQVCLSAVFTTSEADARAVKARLDAGDDIATVAKEDSTESQSAANEGNIGCGTVTQAAQFVGSSLTADAENGDIIGPAQTNAVEGQSWIVARVDSMQVQTFDQLRAQLEQTVPNADQSALQRTMRVLMRRADVTVTSKYGTWDPKAGTVVPPVGATATTAPPTSAPAEQPVPADAG
jgi:foldase protein PrsA